MYVFPIGYSLLAIPYRLFPIGYSLLAIPYQLFLIGYSLLVIPLPILVCSSRSCDGKGSAIPKLKFQSQSS